MSTIADVARLAGVSAGTVSRVLNGATNVNPDTRTKVEQAIASLSYQPNVQARSLRNRRTEMIALAIPELTNYFWTTLARGVQSAAQFSGYHVIICDTYAGHPDSLHYLESIYSRVDAMILSRQSEWAALTGENVQPPGLAMKAHDKPIVVVAQSQAASWNVDNVYSDSISGAFALTEHLIQVGRQNIAIVTGRQSSSSARDRVAGYCMALSRSRLVIDPGLICWGEYERQTAERLTFDLMKRCPEVTAIMAANNEIAIGVLQALEKLHLPVPGAVSVVCFDDFYPDSRYASLVTVAAQSPYDIGINAAQLLLSRLNTNQFLNPRTVVLPMRLIVRQSCGGQTSTIKENAAFGRLQGQLIPSLPADQTEALAAQVRPFVDVTLPSKIGLRPLADRSQVTSIKQTLSRGGSSLSAIPHFEYAVNNCALYRYVLEREPQEEWIEGTSLISPEDQVEFAQRSGIVAVACRFPFRPTTSAPEDGRIKNNGALSFAFPSFTDYLHFFDRYIRAARNSNVGIAADFRSIFADTLAIYHTLKAADPAAETVLLQNIADSLFHFQSKVVQLICDRFGTDLTFVLFSDEWADENGLPVPVETFEAVFRHRLQALVYRAQEHGLSTVLYTPGKLETVIPLIQQTGFDAVYVAQPALNDLAVLNQIAEGRLSFMGGISNTVLHHFDGRDIEQQVVAASSLPGSGDRYIAGIAPEISSDFPFENYPELLRVLSGIHRR